MTDYAIYMMSPTGEVTNWNRGAQRIKGYAPRRSSGSTFRAFMSLKTRTAGFPIGPLIWLIGRADTGGGPRQRKDGNRFWVSVVIDAIYDDGTLVGFAKITRDLSERREAQL